MEVKNKMFKMEAIVNGYRDTRKEDMETSEIIPSRNSRRLKLNMGKLREIGLALLLTLSGLYIINLTYTNYENLNTLETNLTESLEGRYTTELIQVYNELEQVKLELVKTQIEKNLLSKANSRMFSKLSKHYSYIDELNSLTGYKLSTSDIEYIADVSRQKDIEPAVMLELLNKESSMRPDVLGPEVITKSGKIVRAVGIGQIMPHNTGAWLASMADVEWNPDKLLDLKYNVLLSATYIEYLFYGNGKEHTGYYDWHKTLTAYNRGMTGLKNYMNDKGTAVSSYSNSILKKAKKYPTLVFDEKDKTMLISTVDLRDSVGK